MSTYKKDSSSLVSKAEGAGVDEEKALMRMSLTSTMSAGLDIGDLSAVWNRNSGGHGVDEAIAKEVKGKFSMTRWLTFEDRELEEDFMEKYFFGALQTHIAFCFVIPVIYLFFVGYTMIQKSPQIVFILHWVLGFGTFTFYLFSKLKNFRSIHLALMIAVLYYNIIGLGVERQLDYAKMSNEYNLQANDSRSMFIVYNFGHVATFMALRFSFKMAVQLSLGIDIIYFVQMIFLDNMEPFDFLENFVSICIVTYALAGASYANEKRHRNQEIRRAGILKHTEEVAKEKIITEKLLLNILPGKIATRLMDKEEVISDGYNYATVLFADLVGWTDISHSMSPVDAIQLLNDIVSTFDKLTFVHKLEKIKTIGDAYLVACGLPEPLPPKESSRMMANFALDVLKAAMSTMKNQDLSITIGMHTGPVVAGVIGKTKFLYDLWGDSVNTASRMQSHGETNRIHVTEIVHELLQDEFEFEKRPVIQVKGKGEMQTYFLLSKKINMRDNIEKTPVVQIPNELKTRNNPKGENQGEENASPRSEPDASGSDKDANKSKELRRRRKAREAILKRSQELDAQMDAQIKAQMKVMWYFPDAELERKFVRLQEIIVEDGMMKTTLYIVLVEMVLGIYLLRFRTEDISMYYTVMGPCAAIQLLNMAVCSRYIHLSFKLNIVNLFLANAGNLILFAFFRAQSSSSVRLSWISLCMISIIMFMSSNIPFKIANNMANVIFAAFEVIQFTIHFDHGYDILANLMFCNVAFFNFVNMIFAEKHQRREFLLSHLADEERARVIRQREESERLLYNILPETVIKKIREGEGKLIDTYHNASVMFADIVGFTVLSSKLDARSIVTMLNSLFSQVDEVAERKGLEKIKTIGDAYMVVAGLPFPREDHAKVAVEMALEMVRIVQALPEIEGLRVNVRIGVHSGHVVGGIIGASKMVFDIWGENVNVASKMESNGTPGCVNISHITRGLIGDCESIEFEKREKTVKYHGKEFELFYARFRKADEQKEW